MISRFELDMEDLRSLNNVYVWSRGGQLNFSASGFAAIPTGGLDGGRKKFKLELRSQDIHAFSFIPIAKAAMLACAEKSDLRGGERIMWFVGMDVGTGGTRAVVVDATGRLI